MGMILTIRRGLVFVQILCLSSCISCREGGGGRRNVAPYPVYKEGATAIDIKVIPGTIDIKEVFDSVKYVHLETSDEYLIGEIKKIVNHNDKYYILDCWKTKQLLRFDSAGHFEKSFGRIGQGPGEYIQPTDFMVTSSNVIILDQFAHKLLFFNMDGDYIRSVSLRYKIHAITSLGNDSLLLAKTGNNRRTDIEDYELVVMNTNGDIKLKGIENPYRLNYSLSGYDSQRMNDRTIYCRPMNRIIYEITDTCIKERYHLNILDSPLPANYEELCNGKYENFMEDYEGRYNYFSGQFIEVENALFFTVTNTNNQRIAVVYNKHSKELRSGLLEFRSGGNQSDVMMVYVLLSINNCMTVRGNDIIGYIDPSYIPGKEEDNPILFSFQIKNREN
jgi:Txe/YoeB family toxin of Txe-Axe toxin-antitoxin module